MHTPLERHSNAILALMQCLKLRASVLVDNFGDYFGRLTSPCEVDYDL